MEREYFAVMSDKHVYLITETSSFDKPLIYVAAYPTGVFANSYVQEYLDQLPNTNDLYVNSGCRRSRRTQSMSMPSRVRSTRRAKRRRLIIGCV
jgi:hypothetical protein